jgi:undecaprenyl diphosphate synthase
MTENRVKHVAIIMDGNGRWASTRSHSRVWGHVRGARVVSKIINETESLGVESLTLYTFSTENWARPLKEVKVLFSLLKKFLEIEKARIISHKIRFKIMGDITHLPDETKSLIYELEDVTRNATGLKLNFAFGYGGREELVIAMNRFIEKNPGKKITEEAFQNHLHISEIPDIDLLIRTGGDQRISNFLLWQIAYAELSFTETKWPDFTAKEYRKILLDVSKRERRFGTVSGQETLRNSKVIAKENLELIEKNGIK